MGAEPGAGTEASRGAAAASWKLEGFKTPRAGGVGSCNQAKSESCS